MLVKIDDIRVGKRLRGLREATVGELVESIGRLGLRVPISVATGIEKRAGDADMVSFELVAGQHRLEACRRLGWEEIEAAIVQLDADERLLWEIDENLCRADLTELERGEHLARRKEIYLRRYPQTGHGGDRKGARYQDAADGTLKPFHEDVADKAGIGKSTIQHAIRRATRIDEKVRDSVRDNPEIADNARELDALGSLDPAQQKKAVAMMVAGTVDSVRDAKRLIEAPHRPLTPNLKPQMAADEKWWHQFITLMSKASDANLQRAREHLDAPVADGATALRIVS